MECLNNIGVNDPLVLPGWWHLICSNVQRVGHAIGPHLF